MDFSVFYQKIQSILDTELPTGTSIVKEGCHIAEGIEIGRTAFMDKMGVTSELEYKRQCIKNGHIMYHAHIGMNTWEDTADALTHLYQGCRRIRVCYRQGRSLPGPAHGAAQKQSETGIPAETGPMLETQEQWLQIGREAPIQPHMGDFMIGFPASVDNTIHALKAGVTTIGNLSQFFAHEAPMWTDKVTTVVETVKGHVHHGGNAG